jgi:hypothetical protein
MPPNQITAHNAGWRTSAVAPVFTALRRGRALWRDKQFRLASQARHEMGAPNGLFASRMDSLVSARSAFGLRPGTNSFRLSPQGSSVVAGGVFWSGVCSLSSP